MPREQGVFKEHLEVPYGDTNVRRSYTRLQLFALAWIVMTTYTFAADNA